MNLVDVMDDLAARLNTIEGLRVYAFPPDNVQPPAAVVNYPEAITYDGTFGRGMDRMTLPVMVMVGRASDRASRDQIAPYVEGSGVKSIKAVLEYEPAEVDPIEPYTAFDTVRVQGAEFDMVSVGDVPFLAATFSLDIAGQGA